MYYLSLFDYTQPFILTWDSYLDIYVHLIVTILALVDTWISSRPWCLWHAWFVSLFGLIYMLFNATYILAFDGTNSGNKDYIYSILDWNNNLGISISLVFGVIFGFPLLFCIFYLLAMFRDYCWMKYSRENPEDSWTDSSAMI